MTEVETAAPADTSQAAIDAANQSFWNELCGTVLAQSLGVVDSSPESLKRFDDWYFDFYPYLYRHVPFADLAGCRVLEVGLGYGTVAQKLAEAGAVYTGLDIAAGPVSMVRHRLQQMGLAGDAQQGSILDAPFDDETFDYVAAIGCFHHTGNVARAIDQTHRILKPGGRAMVMVYNAFSYRRWQSAFKPTLRHWWRERMGHADPVDSDARARAAYDASTTSGEGAPATVFLSRASVRKIAAKYNQCTVYRENFDHHLRGELNLKTRRFWCRALGPVCGLDLYIHLVK